MMKDLGPEVHSGHDSEPWFLTNDTIGLSESCFGLDES